VRILSVVGNRAQLATSVPISLALRERGMEEVVVHTGPPNEREELDLPTPAYQLDAGSGTQGEETGRLLPGIEAVLLAEQPDAVLVFGGSNATLAGTLAAGKLLVRVAHVEARLRSFDGSLPEELNGVLVDRLANLLFCPTQSAVENLAAEGITEGVHVVGDVAHEPKAAAKIADLLNCNESR
jgi:UDP-GlcNAc3NAcA epimerase